MRIGGCAKRPKKVVGERQYDQDDLERLGLITTLYDTVFSTEEVEVYMRLLEEPKSEQTRLRMLNQRRDAALVNWHLRERLLQRLDYLRHEIQNQK